MRRPIGGDEGTEKYLLAVDQAVEGGIATSGATLGQPIKAWTGGAWTWTWRVSREPVADLVVSARPYFFPSGTDDASFKEVRVEVGGRVWLEDARDTSSTVLFFTERLARDEIIQEKNEDLMARLLQAVRDGATELLQRSEEFAEAQRRRVNWVDRFNQELRSNQAG